MIAVVTQAALPTARSIRWAPVASLGGVLLVAALLSRAADRPADMVLAVASAALAATVVAALHDPAAVLLEPLPVSTMQRRVLRLVLVAVPVLVIWLLLSALTTTSTVFGPGSLVALAAGGVAVAVWAPWRRGLILGVVVPVAWFLLDRVPLGNSIVADAAGWRRTDPWPVAAVAVLACIAGRQR